ncbi:hypothetical protein C8R44DRAFT_758572 [Mycena epipterygia]|nr:hypothetical protein C8R44DRAFT_758572 [Mycena epipterygia]
MIWIDSERATLLAVFHMKFGLSFFATPFHHRGQLAVQHHCHHSLKASGLLIFAPNSP